MASPALRTAAAACSALLAFPERKTLSYLSALSRGGLRGQGYTPEGGQALEHLRRGRA